MRARVGKSASLRADLGQAFAFSLGAVSARSVHGEGRAPTLIEVGRVRSGSDKINILEPISKITPEQQHDAGELHHGEKVVEQVFVAGDELAPVLKPGVGTFNLPPTFV